MCFWGRDQEFRLLCRGVDMMTFHRSQNRPEVL
jgi:hypothetical protein